jgi:hypothetical protein
VLVNLQKRAAFVDRIFICENTSLPQPPGSKIKLLSHKVHENPALLKAANEAIPSRTEGVLEFMGGC